MATNSPFPWMPMFTASSLLQSFDGDIYDGSSTTLLYKYLDTLVGSTGVGSLLNQMFLTNLGSALETIYFNELDYVFGSMNFVARTSAESYPYNPGTDMLTSAQWDEVRIKDAWYRARIKDYFTAIQMGGTPDGIRECIKAAVACDCNVFEVWRYLDNFGIVQSLGRAPAGWTASPTVSGNRNEVVVQPLKSSLSPGELRLCRDMLQRMVPLETIVTVDKQGLAVSTPIPVNAACSDSTYYEVQKMITSTPLLRQLPPPEFLPIDLLPSEQWLLPTDDERHNDRDHTALAPHAAFNITQQFGYYYLIGGGRRSPIDSVTYSTLNANGTTTTAPNFSVFESAGSFTDWTAYDRADSPDNYPGGKFGRHPSYAPPDDVDGRPYHFPWNSQSDYVTARIIEILGMGGDANGERYRLPIQKPSTAKLVYYPNDAIAFSAPSTGSTVTKSITNKKGPQKPRGSWQNPSVFVRSG
jgi:hypothetical protein